ncbi:hypothetical protein H4P12_10080 [Paracoccus sp. 11-3]|uniref:Uncharacterized protein n=1 Tax=Paracoccus amoyensis TaxID=2760093 RepID=A0A926JD25_9RHOB|nr:hypothetical protein [Paracoccus amoyensis]MBC9247059.1 hypothetical protein [Paracoccus amoyensis]
MSRYVRPRLSGVSIFFSFALATQGTTPLTDRIGFMRDAGGLVAVR